MSIGIVKHGTLSEKKRLYWEVQLFALTRSLADGLTLFKFNFNFDKYKSDHSPAFQIELTIFNVYSHFWVYQDNYDEEMRVWDGTLMDGLEDEPWEE
jgi:hypothetical protein